MTCSDLTPDGVEERKRQLDTLDEEIANAKAQTPRGAWKKDLKHLKRVVAPSPPSNSAKKRSLQDSSHHGSVRAEDESTKKRA